MRDTRLRSPRRNSRVWPPQAWKHACGAREAHTCLHVLILFSFWRFFLFLALALFRKRVLFLRFYLACLRYSSGRTNLVVQPTPLPAPLDTSRDLNSFYFPYISRFTTPFYHPPASYVSSNGFSPSFAPSSLPALLSQPPLLRRYAHPSSILSCAALSSFIPYPTLLPTCVLSIARFPPEPPSDVGRRVSVCEKILLIAEESLKRSMYARGWCRANDPHKP